MTSPAAVAFLYTLICLIWGSTWLVIKIGLVGVPPFLSAGLRFTIASAVLFGLVRLNKRKLRVDRPGQIAILSCGLLSFAYGYAATYWAEEYIASGLTAILWCTLPLGVALLSRFWTRSETLTPGKVFGILLGMGGTAALFWTGDAFATSQARGMAAALSAVAAVAVNTVVVKKHGKNTDVFALNAWSMAIGAVCLLLMSLASESYAALAWSRSNVSALAYLALAGSVVTFLSYYHLLKLMDATKASMVSLIYPIIALIIGKRFGGETITRGSLAAIAAVLAGVAVALFSRPKRPV